MASARHQMTQDPTLPVTYKIDGKPLRTALPVSLLERLDAHALKTGMSKTSIIQAALNQWLAENDK